MQLSQNIEMGLKAKDTITGFKGIITGFTTYITGCSQYLLTPKVKKDGSPIDGHWFDEDRIELTKGKQLVLKTNDTNGCDIPAPIR